MVKVFERGPYIQAALICEKVIEDKEGVLTLVRVIDRVTHSLIGPGAPEKMPPINYPLSLVVMLKSGPARGTYPLRVDLEHPNAERQPGAIFPVHLEGEERGQNLILNMTVLFKEPGLYWFDVYFEDNLLTRIPLRVLYSRTVPSPARPQGQGPQSSG